ncbi:MAG TPA: response regulator [Actinomycetota bacterium]|nr:response regulator [Actinomycetota bacterium]
MAIQADMTRVLLVDDAAESRSALRTALSFETDIDVVGEAGTGNEAVERVGEFDPDVVLMDIRMPGEGGIVATRRISEAYPRTRVVALTAHEDDESVREMLRAGATGYVVKGAPIAEVLAAIRAASRGEGILDDRVLPTAIDDLRRLLMDERRRRIENEKLARMREEFVHVLAHELRSPLTVLTGALRFFEQRTPKGDVAELIQRALKRGRRLEHLVEGLELIGEAETTNTVTHPRDDIEEVLGRISAPPVAIQADEAPWKGVPARHFRRVTHELIDNAVRHGEAPIHISARIEEGHGVLTVSDSGHLEPSDELFLAFHQEDMSATRERGGFGLGLFVARRLCEALGGKLEMRREGGKTVAEARFPLALL